MEALLVGFLLVLIRVAAFVSVFPLFSGRNLPRHVKVGLSVALAVTWFAAGDAVSAAAVLSIVNASSWVRLALAIANEALLGAFLGYGFGLLLLPMRIAGSYVGQELGLTMSTVADPTSNTQSNVVSQAFDALGVVLFFVLDVHHALLVALHATFGKWPAGTFVAPFSQDSLSPAVAEAHQWGLLVAAPVAICLFLTVILLALMIKSAPQLNLFSVGMTLRLAVGLAVALLFLPETVLLMRRVFRQAPALADKLLGAG